MHYADGSKKQFGYNVNNGRVEKYDLQEGEHLIGAKMETGEGRLMAVTFLTAKRI